MVKLPGTDIPHCHGEWLHLLLISGNPTVLIRLYFGNPAVKHPGWDVFCLSLSCLFSFPLPACLFNVMLGALALCLVRIALFLQGAFLALLMLQMVLLLGNRRGRLEKFQLEVVAPLPKNKIKNKYMEINSSPLHKEGGRNNPLVPERDGERRKEGVYVPTADVGEGKYDHTALRSSHVLGCIFTILLTLP